jgi:hypothetical protein
MKKFILFLLFSIALSGYAQDSTLVTNTDAEKLIDKYSAKIEATIISLAENLKKPAEHVYSVLIKQQVVQSWTWLIVLILMFVVLVFLWAVWYLDSGRNEWWGMPAIFTLIYFLIIPFTINVIVTGFLNPEYGALMEIANFMK